MSDDDAQGQVAPLGEDLNRPPTSIESALEKQTAAQDGQRHMRSGQVRLELNAITPETLRTSVRAQRIDWLETLSLFSNLSRDDILALSDVFEGVDLDAGVQFITQDMSNPYLYLVVSGELDVYRVDDRGETIGLRAVGVGEPFGEMGYFSDGLRSASVRTAQPTRLLRARYVDLTRIFEQTPRLAMAFWQVVTQRLNELSVEFEADRHRRRSAERSLEHLHEFLDLSETLALGAGMETVIENLVVAASSLMHADRASLFLADNSTRELYSLVVEGEEIRELRIPFGIGLAGWVAEHERLVNIEDAYEDARFNKEVDRQTGYRTRTIMCGPIKKMHNELLGVVQVINKSDGMFDIADERLFRVFTRQAAVAVENYHLYAKVIASHEQMAIMLDISKSLSESLDLGDIISKIVAKMTQALKCERSSFFVLDHDSNELWSMQTYGSEVNEIRFPASTGLAGHAATTGDVVNTPDAYEDSRFNQSIDKASGLRTHSVLCMPVLNRDGDVSGVAQVINKLNGIFDESDEALLRAIAAQIGVVLDNAQLYARTVEMNQYLESVQESISNGIVTLDENGVVVTANKAAREIFEFSGLADGRLDLRGVLGQRNSEIRAVIDRGYANRVHVVQPNVELNRETAGPGTVNVHVEPLDVESTDSHGLVVVVEDVTREMQVKSTLTRYMAKDVVERMLQDPKGQALGGSRGEASVLFSDIRGFTSIAEKMTAEQTMDMLNEYFTLMVDEVMHEHGLLDKFMGDGLMAVFGVPYPHDDDAVRSVRCALRMLDVLVGHNRSRSEQGLDSLRIGVGIHSDEVISGNMGSAKRMEYTVIGDGVNLASRIEGLNKAYDTSLLISGSTWDALEGQFGGRRIDNVAVKGRAEPVRVYEVLGHGDYHLSAPQQAFVEGLECYEQRAFRQALEHFWAGAGTDGPCRTYVARCQEYIRTPPPPDWDRVWEAGSK